MAMIRNQFTFYRSYYDSLVELPDEEQAQTLLAIIRYAIYGTLPEKLSISGKIAFNLVKPTLDSSRKKAAAGRTGGCSDSSASQSRKSKNKSASPSGKSKTEKCLSEPSKLDIDIDIERELDIDIGIGETPASGTSRDDVFEQILRVYPAHRIGNREACIEAWNTVETGQEKAVLEGLSKWKDSNQWEKDGGRYIPSLPRFLTEKMWTFQPPPEKSYSCKCNDFTNDPDFVKALRNMFPDDKEKQMLSDGKR